jgi:predicted GNAT superfamily acetyltransferase
MVAIEQLQRDAWGWQDLDIVNSTMLKAVSYAGGLVAAAYAEGCTQPVGFVAGLVAWHEGKLWHHSDLLAVHPEHRGTGLALALKHHQRRCVLAQGIHHMTWTFDPLIARNARFNFHKLGTVASSYHRNWYGDMGGVNAGLSNDRLIASWDLLGAEHYKPAPDYLDLSEPKLEADHSRGFPKPFSEEALQTILEQNPETLWLEIPSDIETIKKHAPHLALEWREVTRVAFETTLHRNYKIIDFVLSSARGFYKLVATT